MHSPLFDPLVSKHTFLTTSSATSIRSNVDTHYAPGDTNGYGHLSANQSRQCSPFLDCTPHFHRSCHPFTDVDCSSLSHALADSQSNGDVNSDRPSATRSLCISDDPHLSVY